ncbi:hypothetical protein CK203_084075 [Vitis vinifera]|uniref:Retrotransposon gag domain-containing protein n=1 Tax=Vitis vinifera TaxID=29760 RepID=A0A438FJZ4_VITVI|nr:hypothetical protein CK203_084075 [Vitis vinifera]
MRGSDYHPAWKRPVFRMCVEGCIPLEGMIASARDLLKSIHIHLEPPSPHSLDTPSWVRVEGRLVRYSERQSMDQQVVTMDQFTTAMTSIQEALASLRQEIGVPQTSPYVLHGHSEIASPTVVQTTVADDTHAFCRLSSGCQTSRDIQALVSAPPPRLYINRDEGSWFGRVSDDYSIPAISEWAAQRWFASLESSRRRTWDDLAREFLRQFSFNTVVDVLRRELEALRQRSDEIARHVVGVPFADFGSLVMALYDVEDGISRGLCTDSSPSDIKGKKPFVGPGQQMPRAPRSAYDQTYMPQTLVLPSYATQGIERLAVSYTAIGKPCYAAQFTARLAAPYPRPGA